MTAIWGKATVYTKSYTAAEVAVVLVDNMLHVKKSDGTVITMTSDQTIAVSFNKGSVTVTTDPGVVVDWLRDLYR